MSRTRAIFNGNALRKSLLKDYMEEQTKVLVKYASDKIQEIGDKINSYPSYYQMDRTGNLLNSLCWGVANNGKLLKGGFYRKNPILKDNGILHNSESFLHEWLSGDERYTYPINGRELARNYVNSYGNHDYKGWKVFFAILAPYWGYWEKGFKLRRRTSYYQEDDAVNYSYMRFAVMTEFFDEVRNELKPARTRFRCSVNKYSHERIIKKWNRMGNI